MRLAEGLTRLVNALDACGVAHAVVGGLAASARGEVRFTRDIDVAVAVDGFDLSRAELSRPYRFQPSRGERSFG